jgi:hypothetical protein
MAVRTHQENTQHKVAADIETACAALCTALIRPTRMHEATCCMLLETWLEYMDPNQELAKHSHVNDAHVFGTALASCLYSALGEELSQFDLHTALGEHAQRICMQQEPLHTHSYQQPLDVVLSLQIEFAKLYTDEPDGAVACEVDVQMVLLMLFAQLGSFLGHRWRDAGESLQLVQGVVEVGEDGWHRVSVQSAVGVLDAMHAMLVASRLIAKAECLHAGEVPPLVYNFHREASLDDFYDLSTAADCPIGAILQYKHRFRYLFHSVSQVVYFHYPSYQRRKQMTLEELQAPNAPAIHLLPLLTQVCVDIPVLAEHSGLGLRSRHAGQPWAWAVVAQRVLLMDDAMRVFCARDLRTLLMHASPDITHRDDML